LAKPFVFGQTVIAGVTPMLWTVFSLLLILWLLGWDFHIAGAMIHLLLVLATIVAVVHLLGGRPVA
jgi:hypothetical protein